jgi:hypothetical protein
MIARLMKWTLCRLGLHVSDPACTVRQRFFRPEDGVLEGVRVAKECAWCHKRWITWDWCHAYDWRKCNGFPGEGPSGRSED